METSNFLVKLFLLAVVNLIITGCKNKIEDEQESTVKVDPSLEYIQLAVEMADSDIKRNPEAWMLDFNSQPRWNYTYGVVCTAHERLWKYTGEKKYYDYIHEYADFMIDEGGGIKTYDFEAYNIDMINTGKFLYSIYDKTGREKYKEAIDLLREQMKTHPRTSEGGFWHKKRYPWQMWLDGLYMASPFLVQYAREFNEPELYNEAADQILLIDKYARDPDTGLYFHGWDESHEQAWSDPETGLSKNFWGRGMGWYAMALVDVLDYLPKNHSRYDEIVGITQHIAEVIGEFQDDKSGVWYQVLDMGDNPGNYLESSASTMFVYFLYKAVRLGYVDDRYIEVADRGLEGIIKEFIEYDDNGQMNITKACAGAGLGGNPYRDGTYEYYINESIRSNDPKAVGPFIYLLIEKAKLVSDNPTS